MARMIQSPLLSLMIPFPCRAEVTIPMGDPSVTRGGPVHWCGSQCTLCDTVRGLSDVCRRFSAGFCLLR